MSSVYTPRPGSNCEKAVKHFQDHPDARESVAALAALIEISPGNIAGTVKAAVAAGAIGVEREGRKNFYIAGSGVPPEPDNHDAGEAESGTPPQGGGHGLTLALYNDGELFISGASITNGDMVLNAVQTAELRLPAAHGQPGRAPAESRRVS
ncbi:MAG: hypothetical protein B7Y42_00355 [Polaromonas sp. 28-63-22]|jgi:hypothetical protein|nr:MAG: hypothetical protein B7Y42_00355 [Polaromonas sp. 28-63-22]